METKKAKTVKKAKPKKNKYDTTLALNGSFDDVIKMAVGGFVPIPKKKRRK